MIPAINAETWEEVSRRIRLVEPFTAWVHIDVADGTFTPNALWHDPRDLVGFETPARVEIHLMADRPEERVGEWLVGPVRRLIAHCEVVGDLEFLLGRCRDAGVELGLAAASPTPWERLKPAAGRVGFLQVLAVPAGRSGQEFGRHNVEKIRQLRALCPDCRIEVDGGITPAVARECTAAGADILAAASYIFDHPNPNLAIRELNLSGSEHAPST